MHKVLLLILTSIQLIILLSACGVKAPPLPPLPVTPQQADLQRRSSTPAASPIPSPSPHLRDFDQ